MTPKTTDVVLKNGQKAYAHKEGDKMVLSQINQPVVLTQKQLALIFFLLIFIASMVILFNIFNTVFLSDVANKLLEAIARLQPNTLYPIRQP